jgi:hypothetical protein
MRQIEPVELMSAMNFIVRYTDALLAACVDRNLTGRCRMRILINRQFHGNLTSLVFASAAVVCLFAGSSPAAEGVNYIDLFRTRAIKCIHPTVNPEKATVETVKEPEAKGDTTTVRVKAFYQGLLKKDSMEADLMIRQAGSIRQMKIQVLSDTGSVHKPCTLEQNWQDF